MTSGRNNMFCACGPPKCEVKMQDKVSFTCCSTVSSYVDFVAGPRFRDRELVVLSVGCFSLVSQVDSQLILTTSCDLMKV